MIVFVFFSSVDHEQHNNQSAVSAFSSFLLNNINDNKDVTKQQM